MKAVAKLLFVALLIGVALGMPSKTRASGTTYTCNWQYYGQCYNDLQRWMNQCTFGCAMNGGGSSRQICYEDCYIYAPTGEQSCYQQCDAVPDQAGSCIQGCINQYYAQYNWGCVATYCTEN